MSLPWVNANIIQCLFLFQELPEGEWFCCSSCFETRSSLEKIISDGAQLLTDLDIEIIRNKHDTRGLCLDNSTNIKWQLISGKRASEDGKTLLSAAVPIFHVGPILFDLIVHILHNFMVCIFVLVLPFDVFSYGRLMVICSGEFVLRLGGHIISYVGNN